jgi:hypothetical protein
MARDDYTDLVNSYDISEDAKAVHLKELNKQTAKKFSGAWLAEYCRGERTALWAFLTWQVFIPLIALFGFILSIFVFGNMPTHNPKWDGLIDSGILITLLIGGVYGIFSNFVWFRCSKNSISIYQTYIRIVSLLGMAFGAIYFIRVIIWWN